MNRIILASSSATLEERVRRAFDHELNGELRRAWDDHPDPTTLASVVGDTPASTEVVAVGPDVPMTLALDLAAAYDRDRPDISVLLIAPATSDLWQEAMRVGVRDIIAPDAADEEIQRAFDRALEGAARRRDGTTGAGHREGPKGRVITVLSPKGGSGKTFVASNLAVLLAQAHPGEVALVDLDLQFGDVTGALDLQPEQSMYDATRGTADIDATTAKVFLTPRSRDLFVLCAPESPAEGEEVTAERAGQVIRLLAENFRYVIVDTAAGLDEHTLEAVDIANDLVLVCDLARSSIRGLRKVVQALDALDISKPRRHLVLNRAGSKVGIGEDEVVTGVGMRIAVGIPSSREVPTSMNHGIPVVEANERAAVSRKLMAVANCFTEAVQPTGGGLLRRLSA